MPKTGEDENLIDNVNAFKQHAQSFNNADANDYTHDETEQLNKTEANIFNSAH